MSHIHVRRLVAVGEDFLAVRQAVDQSLSDPSLPNHARLTRAAWGLEATYLARLFSEFEGTLRAYLRANDPQGRPPPKSAYGLINRTAALLRLPNDIRDGVQQAREYRNAVVHPDGPAYAALPFSEARSLLSKFLARLP